MLTKPDSIGNPAIDGHYASENRRKIQTELKTQNLKFKTQNPKPNSKLKTNQNLELKT